LKVQKRALGAFESHGICGVPVPQGHIVFESSVVASHLVAAGVPEQSIICDWSTWDTVGNAVFTRQVLEAAASPLSAHALRVPLPLPSSAAAI
jgi:uncharacterized SAM-binding protein YcdF (DUF218 family)